MVLDVGLCCCNVRSLFAPPAGPHSALAGSLHAGGWVVSAVLFVSQRKPACLVLLSDCCCTHQLCILSWLCL